jgi:hypothetical protein
MIYCDNTGMVTIMRNPLFHKRTKHIDWKYYWVCKKIQANKLTMEFFHINEQITDILIKPLTCKKHEKHVTNMGLVLV